MQTFALHSSPEPVHGELERFRRVRRRKFPALRTSFLRCSAQCRSRRRFCPSATTSCGSATTTRPLASTVTATVTETLRTAERCVSPARALRGRRAIAHDALDRRLVEGAASSGAGIGIAGRSRASLIAAAPGRADRQTRPPASRTSSRRRSRRADTSAAGLGHSAARARCVAARSSRPLRRSIARRDRRPRDSPRARGRSPRR